MPEQIFYGLALIVSITGLATIDHRLGLAYWRDKKATTLTIAISVIVFSIWDIVGIVSGVFFHSGSPYTMPLRIFPEFPLEELLFLVLLSYSSLLLYLGLVKQP